MFFVKMSIVSSRVSSVASILKTPGSRSSLLDQPKRIRFKLPDDLRNVILNFETGADSQMYRDLVCILRDSNLKVCICICTLTFFVKY